MNCKKYRIKLIFTFLLISFYGIIFADVDFLFKEGIEYYKKGDFVSAEKNFSQIFESLKTNRQLSPEVLYNLGNCYYRQNKLGLARYYYELAKKYDYYDKDINYNLNYIKKITANTLEDGFVIQVVKILSLKEWFLVILFFNILFFGILVIENFKIFYGFYWIKRISFLFFIIFLVLGIIKYFDETKKVAIVVETTNLLSAPEESDFVKSVNLNEAKKVVILSEKDDYYAVYLPQDKTQGWIKKEKIKLLN